MRTELILRNRIKKEEILMDSIMKKAMSRHLPDDRHEAIDDALRDCVIIKERIATLRWVLGEISEL